MDRTRQRDWSPAMIGAGVGAAVGGGVGSLAFGPVGAAVGAAIGAIASSASVSAVSASYGEPNSKLYTIYDHIRDHSLIMRDFQSESGGKRNDQ